MWDNYLPNRRRIRRPIRQSGASPSRAKLIAKATKIAFVIVIIGFVGLLISFPLIARELPSPNGVIKQSGFSSKILDRNGQVLYDVYANENNTPIEFKDMPQYLRQGVIAIEDKNFYKNN